MLQTFLSDGRMREFLTQARTIAVVGAKDKEGQPVDRVGKYLIQAGYQVIPVHPIRKDVWGLQTYPSLAEVPFPLTSSMYSGLLNTALIMRGRPWHSPPCPNCFGCSKAS